MGYYNNEGVWMEGNPPPAAPLRMPRQMRPAAERQDDANPGVRQQARRELRQGHYDEDGNWIEGEPANTAETLEDVGRSGVTGVQRGVAGMVGMFGDAQELGAQAVGVGQYWVERAGGASDEEARARTQAGIDASRAIREARNMQLPRTEDVNAAIEQVAGPQHEPETTAGEYARTVGEFAPALLFPEGRAASAGGSVIQRGVSAAGTAARRATTEVVAPGVVSEAAGQVTEDTPIEAPARIIGALLGAGVSQNTLNILTRQGLTPDERALRLIRRELTDAGYSPDEITRVAGRLINQRPTEEVLGELMGPSGRRLMRATAAMGRGRGRAAAENVFETRALGRAGPRDTEEEARRGVSSIQERVMHEASRTFAPEQTRAPLDYWDALMTLRRARKAQATDNYQAAYRYQMAPEDVQDYVMPALQNASSEAMTSGAAQLASQERRLLAELNRLNRQATQAGRAGSAAPEESLQRARTIESDLADVRAARQQLEGFAAGEPPATVNARALDYYNRGLRQLERARGPGTPEGASYGDEAREFRNLVQEVNPALADAIGNFANSKRVQDFMQAGRRVFEMSDGELERVLQGDLMAGEADNIVGNRELTTEEFDAFQLGVLDAFEQKLGSNSTGFLPRLMRNRNWLRNLIRSTGAEATEAQVTNLLNGKGSKETAEARRFINRLTRELGMQRTRNEVLSGSRTTPLSEDIAALTTGENEFSFLADAGGVQNFVSRVSAGSKNPLDASVRLATWLYDRFHRPGIANPQVQEAMARRLFARVTRESSKELREALLSIPDRQDLHPALRAFARSLLATQATDDQPAP